MPLAMSTLAPQEVIEDIRSGDFLLDVEGESAKVKRGAQSLQQKLNRTLKLLSEDLYSKETHFLLELIQNAEDNDYGPKTSPRLELLLSPGCLVVRNNETGFSEKNVRALCDVGKSSKTKRSGYIGEKGIGFKSVFTVSSTPEIHSNGYHFKFDRSDDANLLGYVVPIWCQKPPEAKDSVTTIVLPAREGYAFTSNTARDITSRFLLFLSKIRDLRIEGFGCSIHFARRDAHGMSTLSTLRTDHSGAEVKQEDKFVRVETSVPMADLVEEKRQGIEMTSIILAFPVGLDDKAEPQRDSQVFAYLPIRQFGFKFSIQADFILNSSREDIHANRAWNVRLRDAIATAFCSAVERFRKEPELGYTYLQFVPAESDIVHPFFKPVVGQIIKALKEMPSLPSAMGPWRAPSELRRCRSRFRELFPSKVALALFGFDYLHERVEADEALYRALGVGPLLLSTYIDVFKRHGDWFKVQTVEWKAKFYGALAEQNIETLVSMGLTNLPCIPISTGELVAPKQTNVFYPLGRRKKYGFESELAIIDNEIVERAMEHSPLVEQLFPKLRVKSDEPYDLVVSHILPRHGNEAWKSSDHKSLIGHLRYIKDKFEVYLRGAAAAGRTEAQAIEAIREGIRVGTKQKGDGSWMFSRAGMLFISREFAPEFCIETLLGDQVAKDKLVSDDYFDSKAKDPKEEAAGWRNFLRTLGVNEAPGLEEAADGDWKCGPELQLLLESPQAGIRRATLECLDRNWENYAGRLNFTNKWAWRTGRQDTQFAMALRSMNAPTRKRRAVPIAQTYLPTSEIKELFGEGVAYISAAVRNTGLLDACGITYRIDAKACVKRLRQLKNDGGDTSGLLHSIYRHLEDSWEKEKPYILETFRQEGLIRVKGPEATWAKPNEVSWRPSGPFLDTLFPPIQGQYRDFSNFFIDRLGVPREVPISESVNALTKIDRIESFAERAAVALAIYRRANSALQPRFGKDAVPLPDWIDVFRTGSVFLDQHGDLVSNDGNLFVDDSPEFGPLFQEADGISILAVSFSDLPRIERLLEAAGVPRLAKSLKVQVVRTSGGQLREDLTGLARMALPYLGRILYTRAHETFGLARAKGVFKEVKDLEIIEVPDLQLKVTLGNAQRTAPADIATDGRTILLKSGARAVKDQLAEELCKMLGAPQSLADTFALVLREGVPGDIEDLLKVRRIAHLPADVQDIFMAQEESLAEDEGVEADAPDDGKEERPTEGKAKELDIYSPDLIPPSPGISSAKQGLEKDSDSPTISPIQKTGHGDRPAPRPRAGKSPEPSSADRTKPALCHGGANQPYNPQSGSAHREIGETGTAEANRQDLDAAKESASSIYPGGFFPGSRPDPGVARPGKERSRKAMARSLVKRKRTGQLMSWAKSQEDDSRDQGGDGSAAAAQKEATGQAAVDYFLATQSGRWKSLTSMPHNNPGFDVKAIAHDGTEEYIEVKGQSGPWNRDGVAMTPTELMMAHRSGERFWLCVVEHVHNENQRALYLIRNPFGRTDQFRFDSGWSQVAIRGVAAPSDPTPGMGIEIPEEGSGKIVSVKKKGQFFKLHVLLVGKGEVFRTYNPATMKLTSEA